MPAPFEEASAVCFAFVPHFPLSVTTIRGNFLMSAYICMKLIQEEEEIDILIIMEIYHTSYGIYMRRVIFCSVLCVLCLGKFYMQASVYLIIVFWPGMTLHYTIPFLHVNGEKYSIYMPTITLYSGKWLCPGNQILHSILLCAGNL